MRTGSQKLEWFENGPLDEEELELASIDDLESAARERTQSGWEGFEIGVGYRTWHLRENGESLAHKLFYLDGTPVPEFA